MYTFDYSFDGGWIHPGQLSLLLEYSRQDWRIMSFSTLSISVDAGGDDASPERDMHALAMELNRYARQSERGVDVSSLLLHGEYASKWEDFACRLNAIATSVSFPFYEIRHGQERIFSMAKDPAARFQALHKRNKISLETPPHHEFGLYSCDLAFVVPEGRQQDNVVHLFAGGGGGIFGGSPALAPRRASWLGLFTCDEALSVSKYLLELNETWGETANPRKRRLKSLFATRGEDWVHARLSEAGFRILTGHEPGFLSSGELSRAEEYNRGLLFVSGGKLADTPEYPLASFLTQLLPRLTYPLRITPQGNLRIHPEDARANRDLLHDFSTLYAEFASPLRVASLACRGLPICKRAKALSSRILTSTSALLDNLLRPYGLAGVSLIFRISGCPNGCSRPLFAELSLVGRTKSTYDLFAGGSPRGDRAARLFRKAVRIDELPEVLSPLFREWAEARQEVPDLSFGDWIFPCIPETDPQEKEDS